MTDEVEKAAYLYAEENSRHPLSVPHRYHAFKAGVQWCLKHHPAVKELEKALEFYAKHESVIKEAYHSNEEKQITVVHTFINHVAREALEKFRKARE